MENYEKKYKSLVEAVKTLKEANPSDEGIQNWVNDNVPELAESDDERIRKALLTKFTNEKKQGGKYEIHGISIDNIIAWLKNQGEQKAAEWSKEDKKVINLLLELVYEQDKMSPRIPSNEKRKMMLSWLKSLKPQNKWKPSDEQMEALLYEVNAWDEDSANGQNLKSLYQDLKKLMEE